MLNHSRAHIRKRAVVAMFKIFSKYPDAIPTGMPRVREKLEDSDPGTFIVPHEYLC
jgi:AP-3 complex subunit delta